MRSSTSHHVVLALATNDVYNDGKCGPSLGRLLPSHRGNKVIIGQGLQRLHCLRAMWAGAAWRRSPTRYPPYNLSHTLMVIINTGNLKKRYQTSWKAEPNNIRVKFFLNFMTVPNTIL